MRLQDTSASPVCIHLHMNQVVYFAAFRAESHLFAMLTSRFICTQAAWCTLSVRRQCTAANTQT